MAQWVIRSIPHGGPIQPFSIQPVLHKWYNKGYSIHYHAYEMVPIKHALLLISKGSPGRDGSGFLLLLSECSLTTCTMP